ncbi:MAG: isoprenylcysteine carboxylmethyltransferase family protein [Bacteroidota bacterium]
MIILEVIIIVILFALFAYSHTWLASNKIKRTIAEKIGGKIAFYRLFYNMSSILFFAFFYILSPKPDIVVYDLHYPYDIITFALQVLSIIGLVRSIRIVDIKEFIGISQITRYNNNNYNVNDLDERQTLNIVGMYKIVRHPVYLFTILFLGLRPTMTLFYLVSFICIVIYFYVGSVYEEKKLVEKFGDEYKEYQKNVPRIIPGVRGTIRHGGTNNKLGTKYERRDTNNNF